jgi:hypothetical protein
MCRITYVQARRAERQQRFAADLAAMKKPAASSILEQQDEGIGSAGGWLALGGGYGSSRSLEKEYLRLTSVPKAEDVRPPEVLVQSLALIKRRWREGCSYAWACSQLKSVRQDLTVQVGGWPTWPEDGAAASALSSAVKPAATALAVAVVFDICDGGEGGPGVATSSHRQAHVLPTAVRVPHTSVVLLYMRIQGVADQLAVNASETHAPSQQQHWQQQGLRWLLCMLIIWCWVLVQRGSRTHGYLHCRGTCAPPHTHICPANCCACSSHSRG